jgi:uncharacterized OB-fold protein
VAAKDDLQLLPLPGWSPTTAEYWRRAHAGQLAVQQCDECGFHRWPAHVVCHQCGSQQWSWDDVPGTGTVYTYTWADRPTHTEHEPYALALVELDGITGDPVRLQSRINDVDKSTLIIGLPVEVAFEKWHDDVAVPVWRPRHRPHISTGEANDDR